MLVALLGVLKAGGAYVPLDPAYPATASPGCWRTAGAGAAHPGVPPRGVGGAPGAWSTDRRPGRHPGEQHREPAAARRPREPGLRHLHLGLDRPSQGGRGAPARRRQLPGLHGAAARARSRATCWWPSPPSPSTSPCWSCSCRLMMGARIELVSRETAVDGNRLAARHRGLRRHGHAGHARHVAPAARSRLDGRPGAQGAVRRRGPAARPRRRAPGARGLAVERLRPHRDHGLVRRPSGLEGCWRRYRRHRQAARPHRQADRQHVDLPARPQPGAGAPGRRGRAVHRRRGPGPRLPGPARTSRPSASSPIPSAPPGEPPVPHGRPRPLPPGRQRRVPGPRGPPGQDPRLPHRAGGDRVRALRASPRCASAPWWCARTCRARSAWRPTWCRRANCPPPPSCAPLCRPSSPSTWCRRSSRPCRPCP